MLHVLPYAGENSVDHEYSNFFLSSVARTQQKNVERLRRKRSLHTGNKRVVHILMEANNTSCSYYGFQSTVALRSRLLRLHAGPGSCRIDPVHLLAGWMALTL